MLGSVIWKVRIMKWKPLAISMLILLFCTGPALAQEKKGAILLQPESDMDRELADDLTEVLISAIIEKSKRTIRVEGKEGFKKTLVDRTSAGGNVCLKDIACVKKAAEELGIQFLLFGKVGKAANGYRIEVWRLAIGTGSDGKPYRKGITGDIGALIEEVEKVADWALKKPDTYLTVVVTPIGSTVKIDSKIVKALDKPIAVAPGAHKIQASKEGFVTASTDVTCAEGTTCTAKLALKKTSGKPIEPPPDDKKKSGGEPLLSTGTVVAVSVLGGVALLAGGGSVYFYTRMQAHEQDAKDTVAWLCPGDVCPVPEEGYEDSKGEWVDGFDDYLDPIIDKGQAASLWSNVLGGVAVASALAAGTVLAVDLASPPAPEKPRKTTLAPRVGPDFTGFSFEMTF
jgi:hypothetical protein